MKRTIVISLFLCLSVISNSCNKDDDSEDVSKPENLNYSENTNWVALPADLNYEVDLFYVYPTVSSNASGAMNINDADERALAEGIFKAQASVFENQTNVFAPFYRQMSTQVETPASGLVTDTEEYQRGEADVLDAFDYFIENLNNNRPFMIAGHSQGTMTLITLIKERLGKSPELRERLVAAYLIGYTVTNEDLAEAHLPLAQSATDVGAVITYNTQSPTSEGGPMLMDGANCINPLTWSTENTYADSTLNQGAVFFDDETGVFIREVKNYCDAQIDSASKALLTNIPEGENLEIGPYNEGVYHRFDYSFWYRNLQENVGDRIEAYLNMKK